VRASTRKCGIRSMTVSGFLVAGLLAGVGLTLGTPSRAAAGGDRSRYPTRGTVGPKSDVFAPTTGGSSARTFECLSKNADGTCNVNQCTAGPGGSPMTAPASLQPASMPENIGRVRRKAGSARKCADHGLSLYPTPCTVSIGSPAAPIEQAIVAPLLMAPSPAQHLAIRDPEDLGGLVPLHPSINGAQDHFLHLHRPLHGRGRVHGWFAHRVSFQSHNQQCTRLPASADSSRATRGGHFTCYQQEPLFPLTDHRKV
jgi:hypothetical protein